MSTFDERIQKLREPLHLFNSFWVCVILLLPWTQVQTVSHPLIIHAFFIILPLFNIQNLSISSRVELAKTPTRYWIEITREGIDWSAVHRNWIIPLVQHKIISTFDQVLLFFQELILVSWSDWPNSVWRVLIFSVRSLECFTCVCQSRNETDSTAEHQYGFTSLSETDGTEQ